MVGSVQIRVSEYWPFPLMYTLLLFLPYVPGNTSGLLGFWDGDKENEFLLPGGALLETNSSQTRIHYEFGQLCKLTYMIRAKINVDFKLVSLKPFCAKTLRCKAVIYLFLNENDYENSFVYFVVSK